MRLKSLALKNFRCFTDEHIEFDPYTALVGANNSGKSVVICALDVFFKSNPKNIPISIDDFYKRDQKRELQIVVTFTDLSKEATDSFSHYVRSNELTFFIKANFDGDGIKSSLHGIRLANPDFAPFFEKKNATEKKQVYEVLQPKFSLPKWQNQTQAAEALRDFENDPKNEKLNAPLPSEDNAFGAEGPVARLRDFIDFVCIPAVKDANEEAIEARNTAFTRLVDRAVRAKLKIDERVQKIRDEAKLEMGLIAKDHEKVLGDLATRIELEYRKFNSIESRLHLEWGEFDENNLDVNLPAVHLQVSDDLIRNVIGKFGHGIQRNYIMALLMVSASYDFTNLQTIIIACEEPELYQHPPQARILANALYSLASNQTQVVLSTHSPYFVNAKSFENIRVVRRTLGERSKAYQWSVAENCSLIAKAKNEPPIGAGAALAAVNQFMQPEVNEMFFANGIVFVEGEEDRALINKYLILTDRQAAFLAKGLHIVPTSGKGNLINALSIARGFEIPYFVVFDADMDLPAQDLPASIKLNRDIFAIIETGNELNGSLEDTFWAQRCCVWKSSIQKAFNEASNWQAEKVKVAAEFGWTIDRLQKNSMVLEAALDGTFKAGKIEHMEKLCDAILKAF